MLTVKFLVLMLDAYLLHCVSLSGRCEPLKPTKLEERRQIQDAFAVTKYTEA